MKSRYGDWMQTYTGRQFWPMAYLPPPMAEVIVPWSPKEAKQRFLEAFNRFN